MNKKLPLLAAVMGLAISGTAVAHNLSYDYAQVDYRDYDLDLGFADYGVSGFGLTGSFEIGSTLFAVAEYINLSGDDFGVDLDQTDFKVGLGGAWAVSDKADVYGVLSFVKNDFDITGFGGDDDTGYQLNGGARFMVTDNLELYGQAGYLDIYDGSDTVVEVGGRFEVTPRFGVLVAYETADDMDGFKVAGRFMF